MDARRPGAGASSQPTLPEPARQQILDEFERRLRSVRSPIVTNPEAITELRVQIDSMLDEVVDASRLDESDMSDETGSAVVLAVQIGTSRAAQGIHPTESSSSADSCRIVCSASRSASSAASNFSRARSGSRAR